MKPCFFISRFILSIHSCSIKKLNRLIIIAQIYTLHTYVPNLFSIQRTFLNYPHFLQHCIGAIAVTFIAQQTNKFSTFFFQSASGSGNSSQCFNVIGNRADVLRFNISVEKIKIKKAHALRFFQNRLV